MTLANTEMEMIRLVSIGKTTPWAALPEDGGPTISSIVNLFESKKKYCGESMILAIRSSDLAKLTPISHNLTVFAGNSPTELNGMERSIPGSLSTKSGDFGAMRVSWKRGNGGVLSPTQRRAISTPVFRTNQRARTC